jgi:hypothetical protein
MGTLWGRSGIRVHIRRIGKLGEKSTKGFGKSGNAEGFESAGECNLGR